MFGAGWHLEEFRLLRDVLRRFVSANVALSDQLTPSIVQRTHAYTRYKNAGEMLLRLEPKTVLDVGAGKQWHFEPSLKAPGMNLVGFDIDVVEMSGNALLDERLSGDACNGLGVPDGSVDLVMGRAVVEHLHDNKSFLESAHRALSEGGHLIVTFPNKRAPFAILNRLLPRRVTQWLLLNLVPGSSGKLGFEAFYDRTSSREFRESLAKIGFEIEEEFASYFSSGYLRFFVPLFVIGLGYDYASYAFRNPRFAAYLMFIAKKKESDRITAGGRILEN